MSNTYTPHLYLLIDPDKNYRDNDWLNRIDILKAHPPSGFLIGGSTMEQDHSAEIINRLRLHFDLPIIAFPGDLGQVTDHFDRIFLLSLLSGRNPEYLVEQHVRWASDLWPYRHKMIPTAYLLIDGGNRSSVSRVSQTAPLDPAHNIAILNHCKAAQMMGFAQIYLEAGSGAMHSVPSSLVEQVKQTIDLPLIVGGGITSSKQIAELLNAGADTLVIGNGFEKSPQRWPEWRQTWAEISRNYNRRALKA
ncbi:MAG TPA: geranylgeranylglyceryl/heptaprenylglyceryl phosphate synthase [Luteibaculaceae bacterium]|nr:geranylgeranylglyceryl/heptaprenylglyceryl phosphate synthase [Luteibaculaceae bacterium]